MAAELCLTWWQYSSQGFRARICCDSSACPSCGAQRSQILRSGQHATSTTSLFITRPDGCSSSSSSSLGCFFATRGDRASRHGSSTNCPFPTADITTEPLKSSMASFASTQVNVCPCTTFLPVKSLRFLAQIFNVPKPVILIIILGILLVVNTSCLNYMNWVESGNSLPWARMRRGEGRAWDQCSTDRLTAQTNQRLH
ncbi:hypothetical protein Acr_00g0087630 [Actinidia rufa]|uniref:Uncharacterized protein n=1 Tax=Actinidia rufa TaxID=165716 RepID=A0A7J0DWC8_9ERIC|nr:hypothetical protein Acr_00g0087630 [Actinidia rufa]